ncbi:MAG: phospholipid/cholesterol/gamma-HCH transport system substrate-binding protein [Nocardioidaceae bacterium]|nr:phospholipid/cholesterol/gamma-HCH transport system substrate-binding protein [Nocardioidaceae bacterium]
MSTATEEKSVQTTDAKADKQAARSAAKLRHRRNAETIRAGVKLLIFTIVSILVTGLLAAIMGNFGFGDSTEYKAVFSSASMLEKGNDVRVAGVSVGEVTKVEHYKRTMALVTFKVKSDVPLSTTSRAEIRFLNLVGDRYLALEAGDSAGDALPDGLDEGVGGVTADAPATGTRLKAGDTIPVSQTTPALDLTTLFNGFQPLFQALTPKQVNELSMNLVQVLQGEGGTVQQLMANTASLTNSLADRDQLIGEVITNLSTTLDTVDQRHEELNTLVTELQRWMGDLARDRDTIGSSLGNISDLTVVVADLLRQGRPLLKHDVVELKKLATLLNKPQNQQQITELLDRLPESMTDQTRTGTYGSWYSYYVCGFSGQITLPGNLGTIPGLQQVLSGLANLNFHSTAPRCNGAEETPAGGGQ